ncbi:MAG: hypothetical protein JWQ02_3630, partial [Capsulimonas sp.]|nr:hypothetical protein [Capsulimonas sp.]
MEAFAESSPDAYQLSRALSLAVRVEPELLRAMRLALLPASDASLESRVWLSDLVEAHNVRALKFYPEGIELFRSEWPAHYDLMQQSMAVIRRTHQNGPALMVEEEEIGWLALQNCPDTEIANRLNSILWSMVEENRLGIAQWAVQAITRMPAAIRNLEAGQALELGARARVGLPFSGAGHLITISPELHQ